MHGAGLLDEIEEGQVVETVEFGVGHGGRLIV
jgi:hypothetical protein